MTENAIKGVYQIINQSFFSYVYIKTGGGDRDEVLKSQAIWCNDKLIDTRSLAAPGTIEHEAAVYEELGESPYITKTFGLVTLDPVNNLRALRLERSPIGSVRDYIAKRYPHKPPATIERLRLALDFAKGMAHVHSKGVVWGDASTQNALLFGKNYYSDISTLRLKLCDFGGALLEDGDVAPPTKAGCAFETYETRYTLPAKARYHHDKSRAWNRDYEVPWVNREIYALGMAVYEICEWRVPHGWDEFDFLGEVEVARRCKEDVSPEFERCDSFLRGIIRKCWSEGYASVMEVVTDLTEAYGDAVAYGGLGDDEPEMVEAGNTLLLDHHGNEAG